MRLPMRDHQSLDLDPSREVLSDVDHIVVDRLLLVHLVFEHWNRGEHVRREHTAGDRRAVVHVLRWRSVLAARRKLEHVDPVRRRRIHDATGERVTRHAET